MKLFFIPLSWVLLFCMPIQSFGQKNALSNVYLVKQHAFYKNTEPTLNHLNYFEAKAAAMHLSAQSKMVLTEESVEKDGYTHFKYQQFHEGLPVFGSRYILHEKQGTVHTASGRYTPQISASAKPGINATTAVAFAKRAMKASKYDSKAIEPVLCYIDPAFPQVSETVVLAYRVDLQSAEPFDKRRYFVAADGGKIITQFPLILQEGVPSTAKTRYYGVQNITTDSIAPQEFILRDPTRGEGIFIYNIDGGEFTNTSSTWDLTNANKDEVALDAHFCTQEFYDMMLADFNWQGQDGNGKALQAYVHGGDYANAFWNGESTTYGDGDCVYGPLTTLEVVGHEFTHGVIDYTSKLVYDSESGAINESLADMFGKMLERKTDPGNSSWDLGHSFIIGASGAPFRIMDDPNSVEMPAFYKGAFWLDNNDVHINSSIGNLWFSMLVDGRQGINEAGESFDVPALGMDKTGQIVFQTNKNFLTESSNYNAFYEYSTAVAEALYGVGSTEAKAVKEAWKAVGLPNMPAAVLDLSISGTGFSNGSFCGINQYLPVKFTITNSGGIAYDPSMLGYVTLSGSSVSNRTINLDSPIAPGEAVEILVTDWLWVTDYSFYSVDATLELADEEINNNYSYNYYDVLEFQHDDLELYAGLEDKDCFATVQQCNFYITNNSCETVLAGAVLDFRAEDEFGNVVWTSPPYTLPQDLISNNSIFLDYELPVTGSSTLTFYMNYANDPNPDNNQVYDSSPPSSLPIISDYLNNFQSNAGDDEYLEIRTGTPGSTIFYQGSEHFASTGHTLDPEFFQRCSDVFSVFNFEYADGLNAAIHACVDFSFSQAPVLEFDLTQFRNFYTDTSNFQYSSMLHARWTGNENGNQNFYGQPEGVVKHQTVALPPFFKGALDLKFYTEIGHWDLDPGYLSDDDFVLLDNLNLKAPTSGTEDLPSDSHILISPNPARDIATIKADKGIKTIMLQNVSGQTLRTVQVDAPLHNLDLKGLSNGFYLLNIQLDNGHWAVEKLVKMD